MAGQGGFGVKLKIMVGTVLTVVANVMDVDFPQLEKILSESTGHDSAGGYAEHIATGKYKANEFTCTLTWDSAAETHAVIVTVFDAEAAVSMSISDPDSVEVISGSAHIRAITRISRQEEHFQAEVAIQPTGQWSIAE
jgi:predicted secreted protein